MLALTSHTAAALALHAAESAWVMFLQAIPPSGVGPIKIEGVSGKHLVQRLNMIGRENAFEVQLVGLLPSVDPLPHANEIAGDFEQAHLHDGWFEPSTYLVMYIQHTAQVPLQQLLAQMHPGSLSDDPVSIDEIAQILDVSVVTVRRMIKAEQIPYLKLGRIYRFVPADVLASLSRAER